MMCVSVFCVRDKVLLCWLYYDCDVLGGRGGWGCFVGF